MAHRSIAAVYWLTINCPFKLRTVSVHNSFGNNNWGKYSAPDLLEWQRRSTGGTNLWYKRIRHLYVLAQAHRRRVVHMVSIRWLFDVFAIYRAISIALRSTGTFVVFDEMSLECIDWTIDNYAAPYNCDSPFLCWTTHTTNARGSQADRRWMANCKNLINHKNVVQPKQKTGKCEQIKCQFVGFHLSIILNCCDAE